MAGQKSREDKWFITALIILGHHQIKKNYLIFSSDSKQCRLQLFYKYFYLSPRPFVYWTFLIIYSKNHRNKNHLFVNGVGTILILCQGVSIFFYFSSPFLPTVMESSSQIYSQGEFDVHRGQPNFWFLAEICLVCSCYAELGFCLTP